MTPGEHPLLTDSQHLAANEKRFRALLTATSDVIYRMSPDWTIMHSMDGRGFISDTVGDTIEWHERYIHPDDLALVRQKIADAIAGKKVFELEHRVLRADGSTGWTFSRAVPILDENGEIQEWFGTASDTTARRNAEEQVSATRTEQDTLKRHYEAITGNSPDLMYIFNLNYRFIYANAALLAMWGRTEESAMGCGLLELGYEPWHAEMHEREIDHVVATGEMIRGEVSFPHATLGRRIYDYIFSPVLDKDGKVIAVAGTTRDISDIKLAEDTLKQSAEKLELLVQERTRELQRSNEDLLQFAHVASHDLKEPVRKIRTFAERLQQEIKEALTPSVSLYLEKIKSATERMNSMIEGVLEYSTLSNHEQEFVAVDLTDVLRNISSDLEVLIQSKGARIDYETLPVINGAPVLLYQVFYNLVNNSLKFSRSGIPPVIRITATKYLKDEKELWKIKVRDNGIGFQDAYAERIFHAFTRLNSKDSFEGTGLGLALCKKIVERHQGTITAHAAEDQGAVFEIVLPA